MNQLKNAIRLVSLLILIVSSSLIFAENNLLSNPGMEESSGSAISGWNFWAFFPQNATVTQSTGIAHSGAKSAEITCTGEDDARLVQTVAIKSNTTYRISGWIKTENVGTINLGASLSIEKNSFYSKDIKGTNGKWENVELYIKSGQNATTVNVCAGIGGYSSVNTGKAWFDDLSMVETTSVSASAPLFSIEESAPPQQQNTQVQNPNPRHVRPSQTFRGMEIITLFSWMGIALIAFLIFMLTLARKPGFFVSVYGGLAGFVTHIFVPPAGEYRGIRKVTGSPYTRPIFFLIAFIIFGIPFIWDIGRSIAVDPIGGAENHYLYLAQAMLHGKLDIPGYLHDTAVFQGKFWVIYPPFPVLFLIPFVAIFGLDTKVTYIGIAIAIWSIILLWKILKKVEAEPTSRPWVIFAFVFGTAFWLCLRGSMGVCWFAHIASVLALLLAINESLGKSRGILVGLFIGCAFLSRQFCIFFFPFLIAALWVNPKRKDLGDKILASLLFSAGLAVCVGIYLLYNQIKFGNPLDTGYSYLELGGFLDERVKQHGLFSINFLPLNAVYMFLQGFHINYGDAPMNVTSVHQYWPIDPYGTSIVAASPFLFFALAAKWKKSLLITMWVSIAIIALGGLLYYNNGWVQYNTQRFALDFWPGLMILIALGLKHVPEKYWKPLIVYAVFMNAITMLIIPTAG